jgi:CMP-N,N'-diacetyllegionaminic acid synthase
MEKVMIMVPARSGSQRVKNKNLRLLSGKPLISYVLDTLKDSPYPVVVNSDCDDILALAQERGAGIFKRDPQYASDSATNDEFAYDFLQYLDCEYLVQVLPTSPFITKEEVDQFISTLINNDIDTLISVKDEQIGCVYEGQPLNFSKTKKNPPSQEMTPIKVYTTSLMGWKVSSYVDHYERLGSAYHGGDGKTEYFTMEGFSTVDIDTEADFRLAETIAQFIPFEDRYVPMYYTPSDIDYIVPSVMNDDGVKGNVTQKVNQPVSNVYDILDQNPKNESWFRTIVNTENNSCTIVTQMPGEGNRLHYHAKWNEWWFILQGQWDFEIEGVVHRVREGDLVFIEKGKRHKITAVGTTICSRLAVSRYDVEHIYER